MAANFQLTIQRVNKSMQPVTHFIFCSSITRTVEEQHLKRHLFTSRSCVIKCEREMNRVAFDMIKHNIKPGSMSGIIIKKLTVYDL